MKVFLLLLICLATMAYSQPDENNNGFIQRNFFPCTVYCPDNQLCVHGQCVDPKEEPPRFTE
ncbi:Fungus-Induced Protein [Caenorhabditis elegans]|uniref:Fungus-Induced Protein n=1 Tax=Caenorhabditis elegans TaxID=6239 RepID=Q9NAD9_CAEEL|nr:Fungus-Induced Protein [Caenorhabditis elegans]CAB61144.2 Fungus-Induced Protein [Caenorhabditis elegans]|eukprot:NP_502967.1 Fungus-Induced Protein [Caenorhabditis elegans]